MLDAETYWGSRAIDAGSRTLLASTAKQARLRRHEHVGTHISTSSTQAWETRTQDHHGRCDQEGMVWESYKTA